MLLMARNSKVTKYKSVRNKVLSNCNRLITAIDKDGKKWQCPDGWFATTVDIYSDYKVKKDQEVPTQNPKFENIRQGLTATPTRAIAGQPDENGYTFISYAGTKVMVNELYLDLLNRLHDKPELWIDTGDNRAPVQMFKNNKLVALLMPLKQ